MFKIFILILISKSCINKKTFGHNDNYMVHSYPLISSSVVDSEALSKEHNQVLFNFEFN